MVDDASIKTGHSALFAKKIVHSHAKWPWQTCANLVQIKKHLGFYTVSAWFSGGSYWVRTSDPLLVRQMLWTSWAKLPSIILPNFREACLPSFWDCKYRRICLFSKIYFKKILRNWITGILNLTIKIHRPKPPFYRRIFPLRLSNFSFPGNYLLLVVRKPLAFSALPLNH